MTLISEDISSPSPEVSRVLATLKNLDSLDFVECARIAAASIREVDGDLDESLVTKLAERTASNFIASDMCKGSPVIVNITTVEGATPANTGNPKGYYNKTNDDGLEEETSWARSRHIQPNKDSTFRTKFAKPYNNN